jgi:o-succinylbenzoate synthase
MEMRAPIVTAYGVEHERDALIVRVTTDDADGWGECAALTEPTYASEYVAGAMHVIVHHLAPRLGGDALRATDVRARLGPVVGHNMAKAALELAVLDAELRSCSQSLATRLGATRRSVAVGVTIGINDDVDAMLDDLAPWVAVGYRHVKLKIRPGVDVEPARALRAAQPHVSLALDANGSYDAAQATAALDHLGVALIEQPLPADDFLGHRSLVREMVTPIGLDESITSSGIATLAAHRPRCAAMALKPGRLGGILTTAALARNLHAAGVATWIGGMYETGIGRAANIALAALDVVTMPPDWSGSDRYWSDDLTPPLIATDGELAVPDGTGLGVSPISQRLDEVTVERVELRPS